MTSNIAISCQAFLLAAFCIFGLATSFRPPPPFPHLDPPSFLEDFRRNLPPPLDRHRNPSSPVLENLGTNVRYTDEPLEIEAAFYLRPRHNSRGLPLPPFFNVNFAPDAVNKLRQLEKDIFTPSRKGERPETPGQVKNYEDDLRELEKERASETTTLGYKDDISGSTSPTATSFVNVGVTRGDKEEYKYNYAI
ncbi:uncharacterized protein LOC123315156 [Coccinella septempunctata]|uniref:uncharacterized protein LOC123315156 n=1 Tax=Coccinella septempunctata TaxID=41139 RepID=UPI001D0842F1|nr:uncharacterized protein LOC123315156 [Coccinella septempunctata]